MTRHLISRSLWRKLAVTCLAIAGFVLLYEATTFDSRDEAPQQVIDPTRPAAGAQLRFTATAYCKGRTTASGVGVRTGIAASDPAILPVGSVVNITTGNVKYNGVYTIMDTGPKVQGRLLDIYMWSCYEALAFGRQAVEIMVLRLGWNPSASTPGLIARVFRWREARRNARPTGTDAAEGTTCEGAGCDGAAEAVTSDGASSGAAAGAADAADEPPHLEPSEAPAHFAPTGAPSHSEPTHPAPPDAPVPPVAPASAP